MNDILSACRAAALDNPTLVAALAGVAAAVLLTGVMRRRRSRYYRTRAGDGRATGLAVWLRVVAAKTWAGAHTGARAGWDIGRALGSAVGHVLELLLTLLIEATEEVIGRGARWSIPPPVFRLLLGVLGGAYGAVFGLAAGLVFGLLAGLLHRPAAALTTPRLRHRFPDYPMR